MMKESGTKKGWKVGRKKDGRMEKNKKKWDEERMENGTKKNERIKKDRKKWDEERAEKGAREKGRRA